MKCYEWKKRVTESCSIYGGDRRISVINYEISAQMVSHAYRAALEY